MAKVTIPLRRSCWFYCVEEYEVIPRWAKTVNISNLVCWNLVYGAGRLGEEPPSLLLSMGGGVTSTAGPKWVFSQWQNTIKQVPECRAWGVTPTFPGHTSRTQQSLTLGRRMFKSNLEDGISLYCYLTCVSLCFKYTLSVYYFNENDPSIVLKPQEKRFFVLSKLFPGSASLKRCYCLPGTALWR